jgi:PKD repeat protein
MYSWDFGDGFTASSPCVDHTFWTPGLQTVTLTVSDGLLSDTATITVSVDGSGLASLTDTFTRPDCTSPCTNLGHEPAGLANWQQEQGAFVIISGGLQNTLTKNNHIAIRPDVVGTNLSASASFTSPNNGPGPRFGLILRHQGPGNYYVMYRQAGGTNALRIAKVVNGVEALLKSVPAGNLALNVPFGLTATSTTTSGVTTLTLSLQGGGTVSVQDSTFSGGNVGIMLGTGSSGLNQYRADDFHAELITP